MFLKIYILLNLKKGKTVRIEIIIKKKKKETRKNTLHVIKYIAYVKKG